VKRSDALQTIFIADLEAKVHNLAPDELDHFCLAAAVCHCCIAVFAEWSSCARRIQIRCNLRAFLQDLGAM